MASKTDDLRERLKARVADAKAEKAAELKDRAGTNDVLPNAPASAEGPSVWQRMLTPPMDAVPDWRKDAATISGIMDSLTLGHGANLAAAATAPANALIDRTSIGDAYTKARDANKHLQDETEGYAPNNAIVGQLAGALAPGGIAAKGAGLAYDALRTGKILVDPAMRIGMQAGAGAGLGAVDAEGHDADVGTGALLGGALGGLGEGIGTAVSSYFGRMSPRSIKDALAKRVFGTLDDLHGDVNPATMKGRLEELGDGAMVADTSTPLRAAIEGTPRGGVDPKAVGNYRATAAGRDTDVLAEDAIMQAFTGPTTRRAAAQERQAIRAQLQDTYHKTLDSMDKSGVTYPASQMEMLINQTFGERPLATLDSARKTAQAMVDVKGVAQFTKGPDGVMRKTYTRELTPSDVVDIKQELDRAITHRENGVTTMDRDARNKMIDIKNAMNDTLKEQFPEFADISSKYAGQFESEGAWQEGFEAFKTSRKDAIPDAMNYYHGLSSQAQDRFREGLTYSLFMNADNKGAETVLKRAGSRTQNDLVEKISEAFGPDVADQLRTDADRLVTFSRTNAGAEQVTNALASATSGVGTNDAAKIYDAVTVGTLAHGHLASGAAFSAGRRLTNRLIGDKTAAVNTELMNFGAKQGQDAKDAIDTLAEYFRNPQRPTVQPLNVGALAGAIKRANQ